MDGMPKLRNTSNNRYMCPFVLQLCGRHNSAGLTRPISHPTQPDQTYMVENHPLLVYEAARFTPSGMLMIVRYRIVHRFTTR